LTTKHAFDFITEIEIKSSTMDEELGKFYELMNTEKEGIDPEEERK